MNKKSWVWGKANIQADRDVILQMFLKDPSDVFKRFFDSADQRFRDEVSASGRIFRISKEVEYSSEALVSSLMQIGLPLDIAVQVPLHILDTLKDIADEKPEGEQLSTADIRVAVVRNLELLQEAGRFAPETVELWRAAYVRRYGNPDNQFVKVVDRGEVRDLNFEYITSELLPHLLCRILGLEREVNPLDEYARLLSNARTGEMAKEIIHIVNALNLYCISYKALLHVVQDIVLEPPHPWMVSRGTIDRVFQYNRERMHAHRARIESLSASAVAPGAHSLGHTYQEFFRHSSAAILARYGAFLGVGSRYGLTEMVRTLGLRKANIPLWSFCRISALDADLIALGTSTDDLVRTAKRVQGAFATPARDGTHLGGLKSAVTYFASIVDGLPAQAAP